MKLSIRSATFTLLLLAGATPMLVQGANAASSDFQTQCSARYKAAKAAGTLGGMKWTDFEKTKCADLKASGTTAPAATTTQAASPAPKAATPKTTASTSSGGTFMKTCSASWKQMKASKTVPAGMKWKDFVKGGCDVQDQASTTEEATPPTEPTTTTADPTVKTVDKNGKPFTAGQIALHQRIKACGLQWRTAKAAGKIQAGQTWPHYWSDCNKRLKTAAK
jgi:hypothetical protein